MNLVNELLKADVTKATKKETGIYKSKRLAMILGKTEPVDIELMEISTRKRNEYLSSALDKNGNPDLSKSYDANLKICVAGVTNPNLKDKTLQEYFDTKMAIDLAEKLFRDEANEIAEAIIMLGQVGDPEEDEDEIKN